MTITRKHLGLEHLERREVFSVSLPHVAAVAADPVTGASIETDTGYAVKTPTAMLDVSETETNDTRGTANDLPLSVDTGVRLKGELGEKDVDYFAFKVNNNSYLHITTQSTFPDELHVIIEDTAGDTLFSQIAHPGAKTVKLGGGQDYFLRFEGITERPNSYKAGLTLSEAKPHGPLESVPAFTSGVGTSSISKGGAIVVDEVESNDNRNNALALPLTHNQDVIVRGIVNGEKDTDCFDFKVAANAYLNLEMISVSDGAIHVQVEDAKGDVKFETHVSPQDRFVSGSVKLPHGKYFLRVSAADGIGGEYKIRLGLEGPTKFSSFSILQDEQLTAEEQSMAWTMVTHAQTDASAHDEVLATKAW